MMPAMAMCLSSRNYGPDVMLFKPERWLTGSKTAPLCSGMFDDDSSHGTGPLSSPHPESAGHQEDAACWPSVKLADKTASQAAGRAETDGQWDEGSRGSCTGGAPPPDPLTFMAGPRDCIGQSLAKLELQVR
jgi:hypothetical protein